MATETSSDAGETRQLKICSAITPTTGVVNNESQGILKQQISAPSYLFSLKENSAPPFIKKGKEAHPRLLIGTFLNEDEVVEMVEASAQEANGHKNYLVQKLIEKKFIFNYSLSERNFLIGLLCETIDYAARHNFNTMKLSCLLTLYVNGHYFFKWYYWLAPTDIWLFMKDIIIRHSLEDSPDGQEVFEPEEAYDILTHFHTVYMNNLPLIHILTFGSYRLKYSWPFKRK